jgi:Papain family cysteine protease
MPHSKGYRPSKPADLARFRPVRHLFGAREGVVLGYPAAAATSPHAPAVMDQGSGPNGTSSCIGHGSSVGITTALAAKGTALPWVASPKALYDNVRELGRTKLPDGSLSPLVDEGGDPATLLQSLAGSGVRAIRAPTSDGRYSDCEPATINAPETAPEDEEGRRDLLVGEYSIDPRDPEFPGLVAACIARGVPVGVGIPGEGAFEAWGDNWSPSSAPLAGPADFNEADHWVVVLDYSTARDGSLVFVLRNSWSADWGNNGNIAIAEAWMIAGCAEAIAFDVAVKAAA